MAFLNSEGLSRLWTHITLKLNNKADRDHHHDDRYYTKAEIDAKYNYVRIIEIDLLAASWVGAESPYSQVVNIEGITEYSQVNLRPSIEQLSIFYDKDLAFVTENENGVVTVYAIGDKPANDYTIQATVTEVVV